LSIVPLGVNIRGVTALEAKPLRPVGAARGRPVAIAGVGRRLEYGAHGGASAARGANLRTRSFEYRDEGLLRFVGYGHAATNARDLPARG
jgi:hypothetical protein